MDDTSRLQRQCLEQILIICAECVHAVGIHVQHAAGLSIHFERDGELGPDLWGVPAASAQYFGVMPAQLSESQAAALAATLPFPLSSNPASRSGRMLHRRDLILARYHGVDVYIPPEEELDTVPVPPFLPPIVPPVLDTLMRDTLTVPVESMPPDTLVPPDTLPDSTRDTTAQSTRRRGMTSAR